MKRRNIIVLLICIMGIFNACKYKLGFYEKLVVIPDHEWKSSYRPTFTFDIEDTSRNYNIYIVMRHNDAYHYNNIWIDLTIIAPASIAETQELNLKLGDNSKWLGTTMDDIVEHRILLNKAPLHLKQGKYNFILQNIMREDPLSEVLNVGIRVAKMDE